MTKNNSKEPKLHENEPNDPLKRPKMLKEHLFIGRLTKKNSTKKNGKKSQNTPKKVQNAPNRAKMA
jgi:hypothetical protein